MYKKVGNKYSSRINKDSKLILADPTLSKTIYTDKIQKSGTLANDHNNTDDNVTEYHPSPIDA